MPSLSTRCSLVLLICSLVLVLGACQSASAPSSPMTVTLDVREAKPLGGVMQLDATVQSTLDASNAEIIFSLPPQITLVAGQAHITTDLQHDVPQTFTYEIKPEAVGIYDVSVSASVQYAVGTRFGGVDVLVLNVLPTHTEVGRERPHQPVGDQQTIGLTATPANK